MKLALKLAYRNLIGAGLRTWLNVIVLSFSFVVIIWMRGLMAGWDRQAKTDMTAWEIGRGQYWNENYDPYDPFTLEDSYARIPGELKADVENGEITPILITQGTIYPEGRLQSILLKGIDKDQEILEIPSYKFDTLTDAVPAVIGSSMAKSSKLDVGSNVTLQWRDKNGASDAVELVIVDVFTCNVPAVDVGQVWIDLGQLQEMMLTPDQATLLTVKDSEYEFAEIEGWEIKTFSDLTAEVDKMIDMKNKGQSVFYLILLLLAMLAIFDTQVLSIFRRQKEIGTYVALGYTRRQVVWLFTTEGAMHSVLAAIVAALYGIPFLYWQSAAGWTMPVESSELGMSIAQTLYPIFSIGLILTTILIVMLTTAVVSYWPSRKIAKMKPTDALRGKLQ